MIDRLHPFTLLYYFLLMIFLPMSCLHPAMLVLSLFCAGLMLVLSEVRFRPRSILFWLLFFLMVTILNPLLVHKGDTILFYVNQNRITLEALFYGIFTALMLISMFWWCSSLSTHMTSDRVLYLFSRLWGNLALILSMVLHFVPSYRRQYAKMKAALLSQGIQKDGALYSRLQSSIQLFLAMLTWSLEHSLNTSDSMTARGYEVAPRTRMRHKSFTGQDYVYILLWTGLMLLYLLCRYLGAFQISFYPLFDLPAFSVQTLVGCMAFGGIALSLPICHLFAVHHIPMKQELLDNGAMHERSTNH